MFFLFQSGFASAEDPVFDWIVQSDIDRIEEYLHDHDINAVIGDSGKTMLVHSIIHSDVETCTWLIKKGADVNQVVGDMSPLMYAVRTNDSKKVSKLIDAEADIEAVDSEGNTALCYSAQNGNLKIAKKLVRRGANLWHKNDARKTAYDLAVRSNNFEAAKYLRVQYQKKLPDLSDGPYIRWKGNRKILAFYFMHDAKSKATRRVKSKFKTDSDPYLVHGFSHDTLDYLVNSRTDIPSDQFAGIDRILVIGDIHGGYDSLVVFLIQNGVMDEGLNWTWGKDHLVFVGDIFDRGDKVTEALWLIYRLEQQATEAEGAVHLILGNHEIMALTGNTSYVAEKYLLLTSRLKISYSWLFNKRTVLGQWLRTKNTILIINDNLFVHAGLSPKILNSGLNMHQINDHVRYYLNHPDRQQIDGVNRNTLMGLNGPFWYRGYMEDNHYYQHLSEKEFEKILSYFKAGKIFVGHTNVKQITPRYSNRVYALDVPFYNYSSPILGLLIEGEDISLVSSSAVRKQIR
ncbi:ankyrin repeat domain-containing protein [Bacteroidota bacterium]